MCTMPMLNQNRTEESDFIVSGAAPLCRGLAAGKHRLLPEVDIRWRGDCGDGRRKLVTETRNTADLAFQPPELDCPH